jgi:hypothetical protein
MPLSGARLSAALSARHPSEYPAARSLPKFGSAAGPRKGVPTSPLRFDSGTPFLDQHITDVYGEARCRVVAGASGQQGVQRDQNRYERAIGQLSGESSRRVKWWS